MAEPHYLEACCWDWIRDQCRMDGRCACRCHSEEAAQAGPQPDELVRLQQALDAAEQEIDRLNRLVSTLSRALQRYQGEEDDAYGGDDPADHPYQRRGSWSGDDWCAVEGCTSKPTAHSG